MRLFCLLSSLFLVLLLVLFFFVSSCSSLQKIFESPTTVRQETCRAFCVVGLASSECQLNPYVWAVVQEAKDFEDCLTKCESEYGEIANQIDRDCLDALAGQIGNKKIDFCHVLTSCTR